MSQLQTVLRRSVAHLAPSDHDGRERMFTSAREAMIRLLWSYDPPLTPSEIDSKIDEFDGVVASILSEHRNADGDAPEDDEAEDEPSSLVTPEPGVLAKPEALPFSTALALPPREPARKLARFEPLSQIGSPTPARSDGENSASTAQRADAALFAALAALDGTVSDKPAGRRDSAILSKSTQAAPAAAPGATQGWRPEEESDSADEEASRPWDEPAEDEPAEDAEDAEDDRPSEEEQTEELFEEESADDADSDEAELLDEEETRDDEPDEEEPADDDSGRESAEDILRRHRERFDVRAASRAQPLPALEDEVEEDRDEDAFDADAQDEDPLDEDEPRRGLGDRLRDFAGAVSGRMIGIIAGVILLLVAGLGGAAFLLSRSPAPSATATQTEPSTPDPAQPAPPTDIAGVIAAAPPEEAPTPATPATPAPVAEIPAGALALETLNLFDGRDPSVFQSLPDNPVRFEGDTQGGFARVSSSIHSTGSRITVGRGVYERLAGRTIRIVVVARAAATSPTHSLRFAYQNGRSLSPWKDGELGKDYAPLSATWTVPKERGGPETDAVLIEPGIPGDGTAADIKSVRIEVLK
ncbi:hypothetical protein [Kaistia defluvii]|uniref:Chemotaxis protein histidine kinase CheA n=1 Tax=Kaistia defluvii TaxID=410841 RepID=A0ABV2R227_9HYPH